MLLSLNIFETLRPVQLLLSAGTSYTLVSLQLVVHFLIFVSWHDWVEDTSIMPLDWYMSTGSKRWRWSTLLDHSDKTSTPPVFSEWGRPLSRTLLQRVWDTLRASQRKRWKTQNHQNIYCASIGCGTKQQQLDSKTFKSKTKHPSYSNTTKHTWNLSPAKIYAQA